MMIRIVKILCLSALCSAAQAKSGPVTLFDFEGSQPLAWSWVGPLVSGLSVSKDKALEGGASMAVAVSAGAGTTQAYLKVASGLEALNPGSVIEFKLWIPAGSNFSGFEPYSNDANGHWAGVWTGAFKAGEWNTFIHRVPCDAAMPMSEIGLYLFASGAMQTNAFLDAVSFVPGSKGAAGHKEPVLRTLKELP